MKIYFAGSIRGGRDDAHLYAQIIDILKKFGSVLTEHVGDKNLSEEGTEDGPNDEYIYTRDMEWLKESDIIVAEVTTHSTGVGYEIGYADSLGKKIVCLHRDGDKKVSAMVSGNKNIDLCEYKNIEDVENILKNIFEK